MSTASILGKQSLHPARSTLDTYSSSSFNLSIPSFWIWLTLNEQVSDTAFIRNLKSSLKNNESLQINRRGLVDLNDSGEKPVFSADELYWNRRLGLSFK